jgi:hypothetical protein
MARSSYHKPGPVVALCDPSARWHPAHPLRLGGTGSRPQHRHGTDLPPDELLVRIHQHQASVHKLLKEMMLLLAYGGGRRA